MKFDKKQLMLYAVTDRSDKENSIFYNQIKDALIGGATMLQLREKDLDDEQLICEALAVKELCRQYNVPLIINDRADIALKIGADGVHVGIDDAPVAEIRKKAGKDFIIGATAKTKEQAKAAEDAGADYIGVGAVFTSPTKQNAIRISESQLREICSCVSIPSVAIGGISLQNIEKLKNCGISGVAVVSALFSAEDIKKAASEFKEKLKEII